MAKKYSLLTVSLIAFTLIVGILPMMALNQDMEPATGYRSSFYTPGETLLFGYHNDTYFTIKDSAGSLVWNGMLQEAQTKRLTLTEGVYLVLASKPYTLLAGNAQNQTVVGYYALDLSGKGTSTKMYTYIPKRDSLYSLSSFIIFSYANGNTIKITDTEAKSVMWQGTLNDGEHFSQDLSNTIWQNKTVAIESAFPVSALCYLDQGFLVPSSTGLFTGNLFYTYAGNITNGNNDLNVIGYQNQTQVTISNSVTKTVVWSGIINEGEVHSEVLNTPTYLTVNSNQSVAVSVDPYPSWPIMYQAALYAADAEGKLVGNQFFSTARGGGYLRIIPYENDAEVTVVDQATHALVWSGKLDEMQTYKFAAAHTVYNISSDKPVSVLEGYGEWSHIFAPLYFTADSEPPAISAITRTPQNPMSMQLVQVTADVIDLVCGVKEVVLSYSFGGIWTDTPMTLREGNTYEATIPAMPSETKVDYRIIAYDNLNNMAASSTLTYIVASIPTPSPTPTEEPTPSPSPSPSPSPTAEPTEKPQPTPTVTPSPVPTASPTVTPSPSPEPPSPTSTLNPTAAPTSSPIPSSEPTDEPEATPTGSEPALTTEPEQQSQSLDVYLIAVAIVFALTITGVLVFRKRRKKATNL